MIMPLSVPNRSTVGRGICSAAPGTASKSWKFCLVTPQCCFTHNSKARFSLEVLLTPFSFFMSKQQRSHFSFCKHVFLHELACLVCITRHAGTGWDVLQKCFPLILESRYSEGMLGCTREASRINSAFSPTISDKNWVYVNCTFHFYKALECE